MMRTFVNRTAELAFLNKVATRRRPGPAQLLLLYGRRRVGKTHLLQQWVSEQILLGECKWGADSVGLSVVTDLIERKTPHLRQSLPDDGAGWSVHYALFSSADVTAPARSELQSHQALMVDLAQLDAELV